MLPATKLVLVKLAHTLVWAVFAGCIVAIPILAHLRLATATWTAVAIVAVEVAVLCCNRMRCPLTDVAVRYTSDRRANFDIYLPLWLARHNQAIFGLLYAAGVVFAAIVAATG